MSSQDRSERHHDATPVEGAEIDDLDPEAIDRFLRRIREKRGRLLSNRTDIDCLFMLNVLTKIENRIVPTLAGLLAFGKYPQQFEPQLNITFIVFPNVQPGAPMPLGERFLDNRSIDGPIPLMVSECIRALKRHMRRRSIVTGILRTDEWEYPDEVLREALVNALAHRDYSASTRGTQVQVELYPDRLTIRNPGGLYGPANFATLGASTVSSSRNRILLKILEDTHFEDQHMICENRGIGISRMKAVMTETGMKTPIFGEDIGLFQIEIPNHLLIDAAAMEWLNSITATPLTRSQIAALVMMRDGNVLTNSSFQAATGMLDRTRSISELTELVDLGLAIQIGRIGSAKYQLAHSTRSSASNSELGPIQQTVFDALANGASTRAQVVAATKLDSVQVRDALGRLRAKGLVEMSGLPKSRNTWRRADLETS